MNKPTALIFFGIILIGALISYFFLNKREDRLVTPPLVEAPAVEAVPSPPTEAEPVPAPAAPVVTPPPVAAKKEPAPAAVKGSFNSPEAIMKALAAKIEEKDFDGFLRIAGPEAVADAILAEVRALVESRDVKLDAARPFAEVSKSTEGLRWSFNFVPVVEGGAPRQLYADLTVMGDESLDVTKISFPVALKLTRGDADSAPKSPAREAVAMTPEQQADALTVAHAFSKAVIQRDFNTARGLADPAAVTDERIAALMIAIEEGKFALKEDRPLVVTLSRDDITWVLTRVYSDQITSEFALELGQAGGAWHVNGLTFSKVLSVLSEKAGAGNVAYSPIVEDPSGGDSLVLYFEFDDAGLTPRTSRQLEIVADILSQGAERVIRINGHADALGSDDYNITLSDKRAESIRQALISMGVEPDQVITEAFGATKPRKPNFLPDGSDNPGGRSQNRRAEVLLDF